MKENNNEQKIGHILSDYTKSWESQEDQREAAVEDMRFKTVAGSMWEDSIGRQFANRPRFEMDKISREINRIMGEYRANRISVDFRPDGGGSNDDVAEILDGMYRNDERKTNGQEAYDTAFGEALDGGMGCWRLKAKYEDEGDPENDNQVIAIEPILSAVSMIIWDPDAVIYDKSDARKCWLLHEYTPDAFKEKWPDAELNGFPGAPIDNYSARFNWFRKDVTYVAEYFEKVKETRTILTYVDPTTGDRVQYDKESVKEVIDEMIELGFEQVSSRKVVKDRVNKYLVTGNEILEGPTRVVGSEIPVVPVYAYRKYIDGKEFYHGEVRKMKDRQRLLNMQISTLAEISATNPKEKLIVHPDAVQRHMSSWARSNIDNKPFLMLDSANDKNGNPISPILGKTTPPMVPQTTDALLGFITADMQQELPISDPNVSSNVSGVAVQKAQQRTDMSNFILFDNMAKSMRRCGQIWMGMAKELYSMPRTARMVNPDGSSNNATLMEIVIDEESGMPVYLNDISKGSYEVVTDVGPSFSTRRDAMLDTLTEMIQFTPADNPIYPFIMSGIVENMSGPGMDDIKTINKLLKLQQMMQYGIADPQDEEEEQYMQMIQQQQQQQQQQPDPMMVAAQAEMQKASAAHHDAQVKAEKNQIDMYKARTQFVVNQEKNNIEAAKAGVNMQNMQVDTVGKQIENAQKLQQALRPQIAMPQ